VRRRGALLLALAAAVLLHPGPGGADKKRGRGTREQAVTLCAREMSDRFGGFRVQVLDVHRVTRRGDRLSVEARMRVLRPGRDVTREVDCAVDFGGRNRVVAFSVDRDFTSGGGWGGGDGGEQRAARLCWREAAAVGYDVRRLLGVRALQGGGRLVVLGAGHNDEVHCLYRNGVRDLRYRRR
jgi:hypothetical protein